MNHRPPRNRVIVGDAREQLRRMPAASVDMVLTSPPYFRLRNYGVAGQIGDEETVDEWVTHLQEVAKQIGRVLVPTGSLWLNVGDTYATHQHQGAGRKSLLLGPERLALRLIDDGWRLRNKIVWQKPNAMPTSVRDRLACTWEALYVFVRQSDYFFDLDTIRVPHTSRPPNHRRIAKPVEGRPSWRGPNAGNDTGLLTIKAAGLVGHPLGKNPGDVWRIASSNYRGPHHATFPIALAERAIQAGSPEQRCVRCRQPWRRTIQRTPNCTVRRGALRPTCNCKSPGEPGLVLDPFFGAGSTAVAAEHLGREWLGIELNSAYANLVLSRIHRARPERVAHPPPAA